MKNEAVEQDLVVRESGGSDITTFKPAGAGVHAAALKAAKQTAKRMKDWESLRAATEEMIRWQVQIVGWWDQHVSPARTRKSVNSVRSEQILSTVAEAEKHLKVKQQQISRWRKWLKREEEYHALVYGAAYKKAMADADPHYRAEGTGQNEWYTPETFIEAARTVMGSIDLDPASCKEAQRLVKAAKYYTKEQDGLTKEWHGNVWLNPPFSRDLIKPFVHKLLAELGAGRTKQAILITHNNTDTLWYRDLAASRWKPMVCLPFGRVPFYRHDELCSSTNGQVVLLFGGDRELFARVFDPLGLVYLLWRLHAGEWTAPAIERFANEEDYFAYPYADQSSTRERE